MRDLGVITFFALIALAAGAAIYWYGPSRASVLPPAEAGTPVPYTELSSGDHSSVTTRVNYLVTSNDELRSLWALIPGNGERPSVDFDRDVIIAVFTGTEPTAGYAIAVTGITDTDHRAVSIQITAPGVTCLAADTLTSPYQILEMPKTALPLTHVDTATTTSCFN